MIKLTENNMRRYLSTNTFYDRARLLMFSLLILLILSAFTLFAYYAEFQTGMESMENIHDIIRNLATSYISLESYLDNPTNQEAQNQWQNDQAQLMRFTERAREWTTDTSELRILDDIQQRLESIEIQFNEVINIQQQLASSPNASELVERQSMLVSEIVSAEAHIGQQSTILLGSTQERIQASENREFGIALLIFLIVGSGMIFLQWYAWTRVFYPLSKVHEGVLALRRKDFDHQIPDKYAELEMKDIVHELNRASRELGTYYRTQESLIERQRQLEQERDTFISMISHELRTPLTSVRLAVELVEDLIKDKGSEAHELLENIKEDVDQFGALVDDLLYMVRVHETGVTIEKIPSDLGEIVQNVIKHLQSGIQHPLRWREKGTRRLVALDPTRIRQTIYNLTNNAIKYSPDALDIWLEVTYEKDQAIVSVEDAGIGIDPKLGKKIFNRFYRTKASTKYPGMGIGLYIASLIVGRHGGRIWYEPNERGGSTFRFSIPYSTNGSGDE